MPDAPAPLAATIPLHLALINEPDFVNGAYDIHWLEEFIARQG
jgi:acetyl-CoA carboxylase, biotin carboxylase subunit